MTILPIGQIIWADEQGFLPRCVASEIGPNWQAPIEAVATASQDILGEQLRAVVLRGSIARGTAVARVSDVDLLLLHAGDVDSAARASLRAACEDARFRSPYRPEIEVLCLPLAELLESPTKAWMRFHLALQGKLVWGDDCLRDLPPPQLGADALAHSAAVDRWSSRWPDLWREAASKAEREAVCRWLMKRIVRAAFERIMFDLGGYTRDLYPATEAVATRHPEIADVLWAACSLAVDPTDDNALIGRAAAPAIEWLLKGRIAVDPLIR